jgi:opacity protein-like surface antigen
MEKMKSKLMLLTCIFVLLLSSTVFAAEGLYVSGNLGLSIIRNSELNVSSGGTILTYDINDLGSTFSAAIGDDNGNSRVELAFDYKSHDLSTWGDTEVVSGDVTTLSMLVNGFYDIRSEVPVTPYIGGGIGFATINFENIMVNGVSVSDTDDMVFVYQIGVGIGEAINESITLDVGYRFLAISDLDPQFKGIEADYRTHNIIIGLRVALN